MAMKIIYASMTGNVKRFVSRLPFPTVKIDAVDRIDEPYILATYTFQFGNVPQEVTAFLERDSVNRYWLEGVMASGNRNWGALFARAADQIADRYHVPIVHKFELAGTDADRKQVIERVKKIEQSSRNQCQNGCPL